MSRSLSCLTIAVSLTLAAGCGTMNSNTADMGREPKLDPVKANCVDKLNSNCSNSQKDYYQAFLKSLNKNGFDPKAPKRDNEPPALAGLPKDHTGNVNWTLASMRRQIGPRDGISIEETDKDKPFNMVVFFQAKVGLMADVLFPHSVHTYWLSCKNCHPGIFKPQVGANPITMTAILNGKYCGKCHGTVAFPMNSEYDCRRCHAQQKRHSGS